MTCGSRLSTTEGFHKVLAQQGKSLDLSAQGVASEALRIFVFALLQVSPYAQAGYPSAAQVLCGVVALSAAASSHADPCPRLAASSVASLVPPSGKGSSLLIGRSHSYLMI
mmetsp:Transcript_15583/g.43604  ORF Transcript_15583/g.43604 Transcript_15583/m.43604 type:complete len:111 (-) Transcript_15583:157-489(-)